MEKKFEFATKHKMRFPFKGMISVEDLWDLSIENLDSVYKTLNRQKKQADEDSLLETKTTADIELDTKIDIVKHIFDAKLEEINARQAAKDRKAQKQKIMAILANKEEQELQNKSIDELRKMIDDIDS